MSEKEEKKVKKRPGAEKKKKDTNKKIESDAYSASNFRLDIITLTAGQVHHPVQLCYDFTTLDDEIRRQGNKPEKKGNDRQSEEPPTRRDLVDCQCDWTDLVMDVHVPG